MKIRKLISLCLIFLIALSSLPSFAASIENTDSMKVLQAMGVISGDPDGNMRPNDLVKRSEFSKMAVLLSEYKTLVAKNSKISVFSDCTASHWAAPYVKVAAEKGIITGYSNGKFGPDDYITYAQAVTIALRLLGYEDSDFGFSYPEGQLGMALSLKLNAGVSKEPDAPLTRQDVSIILTNTLSAEDKDSGSEYINTLGYSLGEDVILIATNDDTPAVSPGKIYTSGGEYSISDGFDFSLVGEKGTVITDNDKKLVTIIPGNTKTQKGVVLTSGSELVSVYSKGEIVTLDCSDDTTCYEGIEKTTFSRLKSSLSTGDIITLAKTPQDGVDYIVVHKSDFSGPYTVVTDGEIPVHGDYSDYSVLKNGTKSNLSLIKKDDIVYISSSLSCVFSYNKKVSGIYSGATPNIDSPERVTVGGKEYEIESANAFSKLCSSSGNSIGDTVVLLLGRDGKIADVITKNNDGVSVSDKEPIKEENTLLPYAALLNSLGAVNVAGQTIEDGDSVVTRGDFAKMAVMSSNHRNKVSLGSKLAVFPDVTQNYWATPYIKVAVENSLMSAYSDSRFYPENPITYVDALGAALKIAGYTDVDFSDWDASRISLAQSKGITKGIEKNAGDTITKNEAAQILYNTLCSVSKDGRVKVIESVGYEYYEDAVLIATNSENSSISSGKILTSEGTFSIDESNFDKSLVGKSGQLLIYSGKVQMFNKNASKYTENIIYSAVAGGLAVMENDRITSVAVDDSTIVYASGTKMNYSSARSRIAIGDTAYIYYDGQNRLKYIYVGTNSLDGPYIIRDSSSWYAFVSGADASTKIMKDGREVDSKQISTNDIAYYSQSLDTAFIYGDRIIGVVENASPSIDAPNTVTVSGTNYSLETGTAFNIDASYGDLVVLCLGRNGKVAASYKAENISLGGYLVATGIKEFTNSTGDTYTSLYARLILPDGTYIDCATDADYKNWINNVMSISFNGSKVKLSKLNSSGVAGGRVDAKNLTIGTTPISSNVKILDVGYTQQGSPTIYKSIYVQRLDGVNLISSKIIYCKKENGVVKELILNNATGDAFSYGIVTSANSQSEGFSSSGNYTISVGAQSYTYSGSYISGLKKGSVVQVAVSGGRCVEIKKLSHTEGGSSVKEISLSEIKFKNGESYALSEDVVVYKLIGNSDYSVIPISEVVENYHNYSHFSLTSDSVGTSGTRVRVIVVK